MNRPLVAVASLALSLLALPALPQEAAHVLSLGDTMKLARDHNLSVASGQQRVQSAQALTQAAGSPYLPSVALQEGLTAGTGRAPVQTGTAVQGAGLSTNVTGNWLLWDAGNTHDVVAVARANENIARSSLDQAQQDAMLNAGVDYFQVVRAEALAKVATQAVTQAQEHLRLGQLRQRTGTGTLSDVLQMQAQLANAQNTLIQANNAVLISRLTLSNALNVPVGDRAVDASASVPVRTVDLTQELSASYQRRPEIVQQQFRVESDHSRAALNYSTQFPSVSATARYSQLNTDLGAAFVGGTLNWSIFDGFRAQRQGAAAEADARADQALLDQLKQAADLDVRTQYQLAQEAQARIASARQGVAAAREAYRIALDRYRLGLATNFELIDVQNTYLVAQNNLVQATNDFNIDQLRLTRALGYDLAAYVGVP